MNKFAAACAFLALGLHESVAFQSAARFSSRGRFGVSSSSSNVNSNNSPRHNNRMTRFAARKTILMEPETTTTAEVVSSTYDPLDLAATTHHGRLTKSKSCRPRQDDEHSDNNRGGLWAAAAAAATVTSASTALVPFANAAEKMPEVMNPASFQPVCPASDGFYRFLQGTIEAVVGREKFIEYGPLIAGGLLRVRLELCVVESFFNEAVGPFIQENGVSWVLPLHETVETFLAGSIFALATTFILVGSTKLLTVIVTYFDLLVGWPSRTFGGFFYDRALGRPVTLDLGFGPLKTRVLGPTDEVLEEKKEEELVDLSSPVTLLIVLSSGTVNLIGKTAGFLREFLEAIDLFVGRYLVLFATFYIGVKFLHYKVFPDFP